jgi:hypothetical protein
MRSWRSVATSHLHHAQVIPLFKPLADPMMLAVGLIIGIDIGITGLPIEVILFTLIHRRWG